MTTQGDFVSPLNARLDEAIGDLVCGCLQLCIREPGSLTDDGCALGYLACGIVEQDGKI